MHTVSIILTTLNEASDIDALIKCFLNQSAAPDEVIIVDGGSTDGTGDILAKYAAQYPKIRFFERPGLNIAQGRNFAITMAKGSIMAVTDGGCLPDKNWLKNLIAPIIDNWECDAVAGRFDIDYKNEFEFFSGLLCTPQEQEDEHTRLFYGRNSAFTKRIWKLVGGYPEWLYTAEDTLFAKQAKAAGAKIAYAPDAKVSWRPRPSLAKLMKMFFLYGRGNGRIRNGSTKGSLYWLRYHFLLVLSLIAGLKTLVFLAIDFFYSAVPD